MKISKLIEVLAQYLQEHGDVEIYLSKYDDITKQNEINELDEMDIEYLPDRIITEPILVIG